MLILGFLFSFGLFKFQVPEIDSISKSISFTTEKSLVVQIELSSFRIEVNRGWDTSLLFSTKIKYDSLTVQPFIEYKVNKGIGELSIRQKKIESKVGAWSPSPYSDFENTCELMLTTEIPLELNLSYRTGKLDLSLLKIAKLIVKTGGSSTLQFDSPNPIKCEDLCVYATTGNFKGENLGNANFDVLYFRGGIGLWTLDFTGNFSGRKRAEITMGGGRLKLILPKDVGIRLKPQGVMLKSIATLVNVGDHWYESNNWRTADSNLIIHIDSSFGIMGVELK